MSINPQRSSIRESRFPGFLACLGIIGMIFTTNDALAKNAVIVNWTHPAQIYPTSEIDDVMAELRRVLESILSEHPEDRRVIFWLEKATPVFFDRPSLKALFLKGMAAELGIGDEEFFMAFIDPENADFKHTDRINQFVNKFYINLKKKFDQSPEQYGYHDPPLGQEILSWKTEWDSRFNSRIMWEEEPYDAWLHSLRSHVINGMSFQILTAKHNVRGALLTRMDSYYYLARSIQIRDEKLANEIKVMLKKRPEDLHIIIRGSGHTSLKRYLNMAGVSHNDVPVDSLRIDSPIDIQLKQLLEIELQNKVDFLNRVDGLAWRGAMLSFIIDAAMPAYMSKDLKVSAKDKNELIKLTNLLSTTNYDEWLNGIVFQENADSSMSLANATVDWLRSLN